MVKSACFEILLPNDIFLDFGVYCLGGEDWGVSCVINGRNADYDGVGLHHDIKSSTVKEAVEKAKLAVISELEAWIKSIKESEAQND